MIGNKRIPVKKGGKIIGYYDTERGALGHVTWQLAGATFRRGGGVHSVAEAKRAILRAHEEEKQ